MGFFNRLFVKADPRETLLVWGLNFSREVERVYRNQLELTPARGVPTGTGLLKARLLSATFIHAAYQYSERREQPDLESFMNMCSGMALEPFADPNFVPNISRQEAKSFAWAFMIKALGHIHEELAAGPSSMSQKTAGFEKLVNMYHHCIAESCKGAYTQANRLEMDSLAQSVLFTHFRALGDQAAALRR